MGCVQHRMNLDPITIGVNNSGQEISHAQVLKCIYSANICIFNITYEFLLHTKQKIHDPFYVSINNSDFQNIQKLPTRKHKSTETKYVKLITSVAYLIGQDIKR